MPGLDSGIFSQSCQSLWPRLNFSGHSLGSIAGQRRDQGICGLWEKLLYSSYPKSMLLDEIDKGDNDYKETPSRAFGKCWTVNSKFGIII